MARLTKIYTRTGDKGKTALASGVRRPKYNIRIKAYGTIDEANAVIGCARAFLKEKKLSALDKILERLQNDLFDLGADLAQPQKNKKKILIHKKQVERLEKEIDKLNKDLKPLRSFILPAGSKASSFLHLARTILRRAERLVVECADKEKGGISPTALQFVNRASDLLFVCARFANGKGKKDVLWKPKKNQ